MLENGIKVRSLDEYYLSADTPERLDNRNLYIINYSRLNGSMIKEVLDICELALQKIGMQISPDV